MRQAQMKAAKEMNVESRVLELINCNSQIKKDEGFSLLFKEYKSKVFNFLNKKLNYNEEVAKDLLMDVFTKVHLKFDSYSSDEGTISSWIYKIANNTLLDFRKKKSNSEVSLDSLGFTTNNGDEFIEFQVEDKNLLNNSMNSMIKAEEYKLLFLAVEKIKNEKQRQALVLYYFGDKSYSEISSEMGIPQSDVKAFLHRAKKHLKDILTKGGF